MKMANFTFDNDCYAKPDRRHIPKDFFFLEMKEKTSSFITVVVVNENDIKDLLFAHVDLFASVKFVVTRALTCIANVSH